jgi:hypothetical protein
MRVTNGMPIGSPRLTNVTIIYVEMLKDTDAIIRIEMAICTVRVFRQKLTIEDPIGSHACSLEALTCVLPMTFLPEVHSLTS